MGRKSLSDKPLTPAEKQRRYRERLRSQGKKFVSIVVDASQPDPNQTNLVKDDLVFQNEMLVLKNERLVVENDHLKESLDFSEKFESVWQGIAESFRDELFLEISLNTTQNSRVSVLVDQWRNNPKVNLYANSNKNLLTFIQQLEEILK